MKSIGVVGLGIVGNALREGMKHAFEVYTYDKFRLDRCFSGFFDPPADPYEAMVEATDGPIFVAVPTPMNADGGCNTAIVEDVVHKIYEASVSVGKKPVVVIKSTVPPGTTERLNNGYERLLEIVFNPEFLTEAHPVEDFKNQDRIIIGGPRKAAAVVKHCYMIAYPKVPIIKTTSTIAEMVKYTANCFLATKVSFANEIYEICDKLDIDYDTVIEYATKDERLGKSHWMVPGPVPAPDGSFQCGFSGSCLIKDLNALMDLSKKLGVDPKVMNGVWLKNLEVRPGRDWEELKGRAVS